MLTTVACCIGRMDAGRKGGVENAENKHAQDQTEALVGLVSGLASPSALRDVVVAAHARNMQDQVCIAIMPTWRALSLQSLRTTSEAR